MTDSTSQGMTRRGFMALGQACALTPALAAILTPSFAAAAANLGRFVASGSTDTGSLAIAYWLGSEKWAGFDRLTPTTDPLRADPAPAADGKAAGPEPARADLINAESLSRGDPRFARSGARVRILGMVPNDERKVGNLASLSIDLHSRPYHDVPYRAWSFENAALPSIGLANGFTVPIDASHGMTLAFGIGGDDGEQRKIVTRLTLGGEGGTAKLRRGVYLISWRGAGVRPMPSWRKHQVLAIEAEKDEAEGTEVVFRTVQRHTRMPSADLAYVLMTVDYDNGEKVVEV